MKKNHLLIVLLSLLSLLIISCETKKDGGTDPTGNDSTKIATITGQVVDAKNGNALEGAIIKITDGSIVKGTTTGNDGKFSYNFELDEDSDLSVVVFKAGYFQDTTRVFAIVNSTTEVPLFQLQRDESSNAGDFSGRGASIYLFSQSQEFIGVKESGSNESALIVFEIRDSSGVVIGENNAVDVSFRFGATPGGGEYLYPSSIRSNALGKVSVSLNTGTVAGVSQIIAEAVVDGKPIVSKPINITIHGGFPDANHFSIGSDQINYPYWHILGGKAKITVLVGDKYSNPVREGTAVYFKTDAAVIEGSALTNKQGLATVSLLSGDPVPNDPTFGPGFFFVYGTTINEDEDHINTKTLLLFSGPPHITLSPRTFSIDNGGSQEFTYSVMDANGNPLAPGSSYVIEVKTGGDASANGDINVRMPDVQSGHTEFTFTVVDGKADEVNPSDITVTLNVGGPNGTASLTASGTTR
jgi:hypothetical protein